MNTEPRVPVILRRGDAFEEALVVEATHAISHEGTGWHRIGRGPNGVPIYAPIRHQDTL